KTFLRDIFSGALSWSGTVSGFTINAEGGLTTASTKKNAVESVSGLAATSNPFIWDGGVTVGYGPWLVGAVFEQTSNLKG
ncbi:hypothetical protein ABTK20_22820, partial [Acinetobacter baumannii]